MTTIDAFTLTTVPIEQMSHGIIYGAATGFVWREGARHYLITNWHVVSGRNSETGESLHEGAMQPDTLRLHFNFRDNSFNKQCVDLAIRDEAYRPLWLVYSGRRIDVVAIPLPYNEQQVTFALHPINALAEAPLSVQVGMDVFILGYPFGAEPPGFPIWKRGSIATEPQLARLGTGYILVDTASRPGMSGSPVIRRSWSHHLFENDSFSIDNAAATRLIGVYSGRRHTRDPTEAQLGIVWPESYIRDIIAGQKLDE